MIYPHWSRVPKRVWNWANFTPKEIACRHCGEVLIHSESMDLLQRIRTRFGHPLSLSSAYRCPIHNAMVGGAPLSMHKFGRAFDIMLKTYPKSTLINAALAEGVGGIGKNYRTFVHVDTGRRREW